MNRDYYAGMTQGRIDERERVIELLQKRAQEWDGHDGICDCRAASEEDLSIIDLLTDSENSVNGNSEIPETATLDFEDYNRGRHASDTLANVTQRTRRSERMKERIIELIEREFVDKRYYETDSLVWVSQVVKLIRRSA